MSTFMKEVDARTKLAGANQMELLLFHVGTAEVFGINVFKVREVIKPLPITRVPEADPRVEGMTNIRGTMVPVIDLHKTLSLTTNFPLMEAKSGGGNLVITEFNLTLQAFHVAGVDRIIRMSWAQIKTPPQLIRDNAMGSVTAVTMLHDGRIVLILDMEKILADICPRPDDELYTSVERKPALKTAKVLFVDDSAVARKQIRKTLERLGVEYVQATNGKEAWELLKKMADKTEAEGTPITKEVQLILSDIEMPDLDGFTLTKNIRSDARMAHLPVILHSSLTGTCNIEKGRAVGATDYVTKFDPKVLSDTVEAYTREHVVPPPGC